MYYITYVCPQLKISRIPGTIMMMALNVQCIYVCSEQRAHSDTTQEREKKESRAIFWDFLKDLCSCFSAYIAFPSILLWLSLLVELC